MSNAKTTEAELSGISRDEMLSALFAQLVIQQSNMAMLLMGKTPHPQTGETVRDIEAARLFIDQLEMIEAKTKGNLNKDEEHLLKQSLMSLRMEFVEAVNSPPAEMEKAAAAVPPGENKIEAGESAMEDESKKKFTKKY
jgi:hypothetical protein